MKIVLLAAVLCLCGCTDDTYVIDKDAKALKYCPGSSVVTCLAKECPNGYEVIPSASSITTVRCKP